MSVMQGEKTFATEKDTIQGNLIHSVLENVNKRFHGYYAESEGEAVEIITGLLDQFNGSIDRVGGVMLLLS